MTSEERAQYERRYEEIDITMRLEWIAEQRAALDLERLLRDGERSGDSGVGFVARMTRRLRF